VFGVSAKEGSDPHPGRQSNSMAKSRASGNQKDRDRRLSVSGPYRPRRGKTTQLCTVLQVLKIEDKSGATTQCPLQPRQK